MLPDLSYFHLGENGIYYGLYGGLDYSAGVEDGRITGTSADPSPVDLFDQAFYNHDFNLQQASTREERLEAHVQVVEEVYGLLTGTAFQWDIL